MFETYQCNTCIENWSIKAKWEKTKKWRRTHKGKRSLGKTSITSQQKKNHDEYLSAKLNHLLKNKLKTKWLHLNSKLKHDRELSIKRNNSWKLTEYQLHFFKHQVILAEPGHESKKMEKISTGVRRNC